MAKTLKATILMLSEAPDGKPGVAGRAIAKYVLGDDTDSSATTVKLKEVGAVDFSQPASALYARAVAAVKAEEGLR